MKIIDARTGQKVRLGIPVVIISPVYEVMHVDDLFADPPVSPKPTGEIEDESYVLLYKGSPGLFSIPVTLRKLATGEIWADALTIRYTHPGFMFQRVAFVET